MDTLENWIRRESYIKGFSKEDAFIGEIRLHNVLVNQIPGTMIALGHNQQSVRRELLRMIDSEGFAEELATESKRRRWARGVRGTSAGNTAGVETNSLLESWIRTESSRVAFSKEGIFIGEIRLHNVLINSITAPMTTQGYTPQSVRRSLLKMIDEGFSKELQKESRQRINEITYSPPAGDFDWGPQPRVMSEEIMDAEFPPLRKQSSSTTPPPPERTSHSAQHISSYRAILASIQKKTAESTDRAVGLSFGRAFDETFGENSGEDSGKDSGETFGENSGKDSGETFGETFGENSGENSGGTPGEPIGEITDETVDDTGKTVGAKRLKALRFPFCIQHAILAKVQTIVETAFFKYSQTYCPSILVRKGWYCSHAGELNAWTKEFRNSSDLNELSGAIVDNPVRLLEILKELDDLRDIAVHRTPISEERLTELVRFALDAMGLLEDKQGAVEISEIAGVIRVCTQHCIDSMDKLSQELDQELQQLDMERKKLEEKELHIREKSESAMKEVESSMERVFVDKLQALGLQSHYVGLERCG